jgi:probable O-glycosylation ligase (exosortase A-associated)
MKGLIFTYALTYGGSLVALFDPFVGLLIYVCFAILRPPDLWYWSVPQGNYSRIIGIALLVGWALKGFGRWEFGRAKPVVGLLVAFWAWALLSGLLADEPLVALNGVEEITKIVLPFLVGITVIDSVAKLKQLAWVILLCHGYIALEFNLSYLSGYNRMTENGLGMSLDNNCLGVAFVAATGLAIFLGFGAPRWWQKCLAFGSAVLMIHCNLFGFTRGGMLGMIVTAMASFVLIPKKTAHYVVFVALVLVGLRLAGPQVVERFGSTFADEQHRDGSAQSRVEMWTSCLKIMGKHPVFGIGLGHFQLVSYSYGHARNMLAHTLWLQLGAETGVPGLLLLLAFYGVCMMRLWPLRRESCPVDPWFHDSARMVIASLSGFALSAQFVSMMGLEAPYYIALLGAGALKLSSLPASNPALLPVAPTPRRLMTVATQQ